jgi:hypothetical protein
LFGRSYDRWPVFNVADAAVTTGVLILILFYKKNQELDVTKKEDELAGLSIPGSNADVEMNSADGDELVNDEKVISEKLENEQSDKPKEVSN